MQLDNLERDYMCPGHVGCPGCGAAIAMRFVLKALGEKTIMIIPACCWSIIAGPYPQSTLQIPVLHTAFETGGAVASGVRAAQDVKGDSETTVVTWAGDGGTFDIGFQALSGAVERNDNFIYVCYDNEAYMNTGVQRSSSTPYGARTTTTPGQQWKRLRKKNIVEALVAHRIAYAAPARGPGTEGNKGQIHCRCQISPYFLKLPYWLGYSIGDVNQDCQNGGTDQHLSPL
jgi:pyruvate/2-oxoacid:ferredoxin oxidoreductase beta subunit